MRILGRYIAVTYLKMLWICSGSFMAIYLVIDFLEKIGRFTRAGGDLSAIGLFFICKIPEIINQIAPLAVLLATLLTLGQLARSSEITAMRSCGIGLIGITAPILGIATLLSLLTLINGEFIVPKSYEKMRFIEEVTIGKKNPSSFFRQQNIWHRDRDAILQARYFDPNTRTLKGITFWQMTGNMRPVSRIEARQGVFSSSRWILRDTVIRTITAENVLHTTTANELPVNLQMTTSDLKVLGKYAENMGFFDLKRYCAKLTNSGYDATRYEAQMHSKLSFPFASLIMAFLGIPFALRGGRSSGIAVGIGVSLVIGFSYHIISAVLLSFGQAGVLPPLVAAWAANLLFAAAGVWLTMTVNR